MARPFVQLLPFEMAILGLLELVFMFALIDLLDADLRRDEPDRPTFVDELAQLIPFCKERGHVKPGVTGWAQVNYPYGAPVDDARQELAYDLYYVRNRGVLLDTLILFSTVRVILFHEGAR